MNVVFSQPHGDDSYEGSAVNFSPPEPEQTIEEIVEELEAKGLELAQKRQEKIKYRARRDAVAEVEDELDNAREIIVRKASEVTPRRVRWLWAPGDEQKGRIPLGELTLIVGRGGIGKSTLLAEFTSWLTRGEMRGEFYGSPRHVMYVANEDSLEYTVVPRLIAAGADLDRVHFIGISMAGRKSKVVLPSDCKGLAEYARANNVGAIMLDPLSSNLNIKQGTGNEIRPIVETVRAMAESAGVACIGLAHTRKAASTTLLDALLGSVELGNVCRSAMGVMRDEDADDGSVVLSQEKNNLGDLNVDSYKYKIRSASIWSGDDLLEPGRIEWLGRTPLKVSDMLHDTVANGVSVKGTVQECAEFIRDYLTPNGGQALKGDIQKACRAEGFSISSVDRAAKKLGLMSQASGQGAKRIWVLPSSGH